jgi:hypothetical protein
VLATVVVSIVVHGVTSGPALLRLMARRRRRERGGERGAGGRQAT